MILCFWGGGGGGGFRVNRALLIGGKGRGQGKISLKGNQLNKLDSPYSLCRCRTSHTYHTKDLNS